jgi:hypothetical protein
MENYSL